MSGWIKLHRKLLENAIFYKPDYFQVWIYILLKVNHEEKKIIWNNEAKLIKKGCGIFSQKKMSEELKIPIGTVNNVLKFLKSESQIEIKSTNKFTEIEVIKWEEYQDVEINPESQMKPSRKQNESNVKARRKPDETNKNDKNEENDKNEKKEEFELIYPFMSESFKKKWEVWKIYKKQQHGFSFKSGITEQGALKELGELSGNNEEIAHKIIEKSISKGWQGLFKLKDDGKSNTADPAQFGADVDSYLNKKYGGSAA